MAKQEEKKKSLSSILKGIYALLLNSAGASFKKMLNAAEIFDLFSLQPNLFWGACDIVKVDVWRLHILQKSYPILKAAENVSGGSIEV